MNLIKPYKIQKFQFFYLATPFLTNITLNKPSIFIYPNNFKEMISDEYLPIFQKLEEAKLLSNSTCRFYK